MSKLKENLLQKVQVLLPHDVILWIYKTIRHNAYQQSQADRKLEIEGKDKYSLKGYDDNKCIFVHIPKAGGVSIATSLFNNLGYGHKPIYKYLYIYSKQEFDNYFKFTFVRNPWDRLVSAYFFLKFGGLHQEDKNWFNENIAQYNSFEEFVELWVNKNNINTGIHFIPQHKFITINSKVKVDKIYKIEEVELGIKDLSIRLNKKIDIKHKNKTTNREKDYQKYYTIKTRKIVEQVYKKDITLFGYDF